MKCASKLKSLLRRRFGRQARYCMRMKPATGQLVLKVTNDIQVRSDLRPDPTKLKLLRWSQCLKFKTNEAIYLNRFEVLTRTLTASMQNRPVIMPTTAPSISNPISASQQQSGAPADQSGSGQQSGSSKKKKGKKKR